MASHPPHSSEDVSESASFDLVLAIMLWIGAICLICAVNYGAIHGVNVQLHGVFVVLHHYHAKWLVAGLAALMGAGMFQSALRRMRSVPKDPEFLQGAVMLESARWLQQTKARPPANAGNSRR
jgi:ACR3 family arsenite efflux pump ArsB